MKFNFSLEFIKAALTRAIWTAAQTSLGFITLGSMFVDIDWVKIASVAGVAAVYSILKSIVVGIPETDNNTDGELVIDTSEDSEDIFRIELDTPLSDIQPGDTYVLHVRED